jgi:hypothetical protein
MAGDEWESPVMPDKRAEDIIAGVVMHQQQGSDRGGWTCVRPLAL